MRFSCPKTSQQNRKSEWMIRTINNVIRTLLFQAHLPPSFWVEALHMAAYLLNILPSSAIQNDIPCTKLFNKQPDYSRLRFFGCLCYPHLYSPHKLAPRATPCIFLKYPVYHQGYRCLDLSTNKIILFRYVTFDELQFPYGSVTHAHPPSYIFLEPNISPITRHIIQSQPNPPLTTPLHSAQQQTQQPSTQQQNPLSPISQPTTQQQPAPSPTTSPPSTHNLTPAQNPQPQTHPMITRSQVGTFRPNPRFHGHTSHISPLPKSHSVALSDPHWRYAMYDEYNALIKNGTWILVPKPPNVNVVRSMIMSMPSGFVDSRFPHHVCRLQRSLYGLKQAHCAWFQRFAGYALRVGFTSSRCDSSLFIYQHDFDMTDLGALNYFFRISVTRDARGVFLSQKKYDMELLERAHTSNFNATRTPVDTKSKLGSDGDPVFDSTLYRSLAGGL
uniref:Ribonuclease H-like domain-containing protein n=1 Tax=Tanacetum cinerariifolium TaxID=118510 RepID=A0A699I430_TANCI|nr:ribonuclease H-like domain-containing protein [Tanacetum cinerariifolium]